MAIGRILLLFCFILFSDLLSVTFSPVLFGPLSFDVQRDLLLFAVEIYVTQKQNQAYLMNSLLFFATKMVRCNDR
jgi:hypothetical protein